MPKYLVQATYSADAVKGLQKDGATSRVKMASHLAETLGGKCEAFYFAFGDHDAVVIMDLPNAVDAAALAFAVSSSGMIRTKTTLLLTAAEADQALKKTIDYRPPGR